MHAPLIIYIDGMMLTIYVDGTFLAMCLIYLDDIGLGDMAKKKKKL